MDTDQLAPPEPDGRQQNLGWCSAELRAVGVGDAAGALLERAGLTPTTLVEAGFVFGSEPDPWPWPLDGVRPGSGCAWLATRPSPVHEGDAAAHLGRLLDTVEPVAVRLRELVDDAGGSLLVELETTTSAEPAGPLLPPALLARVAALAAHLSVDQRCGLEHVVG